MGFNAARGYPGHRACRPVFLDPVRPGPTRPRRPARASQRATPARLPRNYPGSETPPCAASRARRLCAAWRAAWAMT